MFSFLEAEFGFSVFFSVGLVVFLSVVVRVKSLLVEKLVSESLFDIISLSSAVQETKENVIAQISM